ncbi:farnesylcysteine lyase [Vigna umbellata]|uniref:farnesylcysteine lyase n=1 Tax=Vigna umbellata TaxID=87088 RepID=UPI001F5F4D4D|nr:farnesylcysteine lyase [Vigna umbellata]
MMSLTLPFLLTFLALSQAQPLSDDPPQPSTTVCIVGAGIGGSSVAHFLRKYSPESTPATDIRVFERNGVVGGRIATVTVAGETFEAGASILHPKNLHTVDYVKILNLKINEPDSDPLSLGIWNGKKFVFKTVTLSSNVPLINKLLELPFVDTLLSLFNSARMFLRYGFSLFKMQNFVESAVERFLNYYKDTSSRPIFETVDEMLQWAGLYNLTTRTLHDELVDAGLSNLLIDELVTVITRINYGQSVSMSGLGGAVSLAGSGGGLWSVKGGNWQMAAGLINRSDVALHLHEEIKAVADLGDFYELNSTKGNSYKCEVAVVATPLDELDIQFIPPILIPERKMQHTYTTFVRGFLNPAYFGLKAETKIPDLVGTVEDPSLPFSCIAVLKKHNEKESTYKLFSRQPMEDTLLDSIFGVRKETIQINWAAYPHYHAPEVFAPFILDKRHLYYVNAFENAASTMETSAVAAENIARLILSRYFGKEIVNSSNLSATSRGEGTHLDL